MSIKNENLNSFGQLWAWGYNSSGQLGDNTTISKISPVQVDGNTWVEIAAGAFHSLARKSDGTLWAWGNNSYGQLGNNTNLIDGTTTRINSPLQIAGNTWAEIAAGDFHSLARKNDGTLWAWGRNDFGQLGDNTTIDRSLPMQINGNTWAKIASGANHSLAIKNDGTLWAWGQNNYGQLGDNTTISKTSPVQVDGNTWIEIAAGDNHTLNEHLHKEHANLGY